MAVGDVERIVVMHLSESRGQKSDERDDFVLAERLRTGAIETTVYKPAGAFAMLRQLVKAHVMIVRDTVRVQSRIKAILRSRGVHVTGKSVCQPANRDERLGLLPASSRAAACLLLAQYDALCTVRDQAHKQQVAHARGDQAARELSGIGRDSRCTAARDCGQPASIAFTTQGPCQTMTYSVVASPSSFRD